MLSKIDERITPLLKEEGLQKLHSSKVVIFGLGGVGGTCFEALCRTGVSPLLGVDFDTVEESNLNRQLLFTSQDVGKKKSEVAFKRGKLLRPNSSIETFDLKIDQKTIENPSFLDAVVWIDAVDDLEAKVALIEASIQKNIPLFVSLGMGNRMDPSLVYETRLDKTTGDPLAKKLRKMLRERNVDLKKIRVVTSKELPIVKTPKPNSLMMVPSEAGLLLASLALRKLLNF